MSKKFTFQPRRYRIGRMEKYYSDMAAKGWHLLIRGYFFSEFEKGEPKDVKYRVEVAGKNRLPPEQVAVYEDCGWEYVCYDKFIHIFRAPARSDAPEFYLDPLQQAKTLKNLRKDVVRRFFSLPFLLVYSFLISLILNYNTFAFNYISFFTNTFDQLALITVWLRCFIENTIGLVHLIRLYRQLKSGLPIDHNPKTNPLSNKPVIPVIFLMALAVILFKPNPYIKGEIIADGPYITLEEMGYGNNFGRKDLNYQSYVKTPMCQFWDSSEWSEENEERISQMTFILNNTVHRDKLAENLMKYTLRHDDEEIFKETAIEGLDKAYTNGTSKHIAVKEDKVILIIFFNTDKSPEFVLSALSEKWKNF